MATYTELYDLRANSALRNKIAIACIIAAENIRSESAATPNNVNRLSWAKAVFADPEREAGRMLMAVLAQNSSATAAQITNATDAAIQTAVNNAVNIFATPGS